MPLAALGNWIRFLASNRFENPISKFLAALRPGQILWRCEAAFVQTSSPRFVREPLEPDLAPDAHNVLSLRCGDGSGRARSATNCIQPQPATMREYDADRVFGRLQRPLVYGYAATPWRAQSHDQFQQTEQKMMTAKDSPGGFLCLPIWRP